MNTWQAMLFSQKSIPPFSSILFKELSWKPENKLSFGVINLKNKPFSFFFGKEGLNPEHSGVTPLAAVLAQKKGIKKGITVLHKSTNKRAGAP